MHDTYLVHLIMITCHTTMGSYSIQEHLNDAAEIGYDFSTLPKFHAESEVKLELDKKLLDASEEAAFLQFLRDLQED